MLTFTCTVCGKEKPDYKSGGTGYAQDEAGEKICYKCCADFDRAWMHQAGRVTLYLTVGENGQKQVNNWPATLVFPVHATKNGRHNIAGSREDVWFRGPDGYEWWGVRYGSNTQLCHCKRTKVRM